MKKRLLSILLALAMVLPLFGAFVPAIAAASGIDSSYSQATSTDTQYKDGIYYTVDKHVIYTGNNQYRLDIKVSSTLTETEKPKSITRAENGFVTVSTTGYYLVELWGGRGADGSSKEVNVLGTIIERPGGSGGTNGYVYAKLWLEKGQTLAIPLVPTDKRACAPMTVRAVRTVTAAHTVTTDLTRSAVAAVIPRSTSLTRESSMKAGLLPRH